MLDPFSRGAIVAMSTLCVAGAVALTPARVRGSNDPTVLRAKLVAGAEIVTPPVADVHISRDPFAGDPAPQAAPSPSAELPNVTPSLPRGEAGALPSNLVQTVIPAIPGALSTAAQVSRVTAIVTGAHPYAMVDTAGNHEIKGIGDRVGGTPIVTIDINGVTLGDGQHLTVTPGELPL